MTQLRLKIGGMSCQHCVKAVRGLLEQLEGISDLVVEVGSARFDLPEPPGRPALEQMIAGESRFGRQLWGALCLELWHRQFIDGS